MEYGHATMVDDVFQGNSVSEFTLAGVDEPEEILKFVHVFLRAEFFRNPVLALACREPGGENCLHCGWRTLCSSRSPFRSSSGWEQRGFCFLDTGFGAGILERGRPSACGAGAGAATAAASVAEPEC